MRRLREIGRSQIAMCSGKQIPVEPSSVFAARAAVSNSSGSSHFAVAKVNKVCYYVLARNKIALTQDFLSWVWDFVNFLNHYGYCSTNRSRCQAVCVNFLYFCILHKNGVFVLSFYNKYIRLCTEKGISPSAAAIEIGIRKSNVTYWKSNRNNPSDATLKKIADYFGVTVEYLKEEETKKDPATNGEVSSAKKALINLIVDLDEEQCRKLRSIIEEAVNLL